ncbi:MAG: bifunctional hydroxymethylpyrimidine kinase/phosphomethylpyrimidine kinase [Clostridia bacterium]|nr:bifunctional hydroxymethylpyrimidine kinase/phosphomethylpyrimidine kinase [Clostridia bacterium]
MKTVLTIAGSDPSGGAGIQADLKTFIANGVYGMSAITSLTSQNTTAVLDVFNIPAAVVSSQLDAVFTDIFPDAVKIGMVSSEEIITVIAEKLKKYKPRNIVLDTVMISTSGYSLLNEKAKASLINELFPLADIITPNIPEAESLSGMAIGTESDMKSVAKELAEKYNVRVLIKGGHLDCSAADILYDNGSYFTYSQSHIDNPNTHGTGCTLSSAIAANLALGLSYNEAVKKAKDYITGAILDGMDLGKGRGPLNHGYNINQTK